MKKFFKLMSVVFVFCTLWTVNIKCAKADLKVSLPKKMTIYLGNDKDFNAKIYFDNERIDDQADLDYNTEEHDTEIEIQSVKWKRSNKNVSLLSYNGDLDELSNTIYGNKAGKTKLTVTIKYKETYPEEYDEDDNIISDALTFHETITKTIWVTVKPYKTLRLDGGLYKYDTRENIFKTQIYNPTNKKIRIYSKGAYSLDCDYKKYDRKVKLTRKRKYVDLKPGKWTNVNFKVIGSVTWWDVDDEEIHCNCKFNGKKYILSIETERIMKWTKKGWKKISID